MVLIIYCCGGHGRELLLLANKINALHKKWEEIIFADDNMNPSLSIPNTVITFEQIKVKYDRSDCEFIIASGEPNLLKTLSNKVLNNGYKLTQLIANNATIDSDKIFGQGCIIQERAVVTYNVSMGSSSCVGFSSVLHHDVNIGDYCFIAANSTICGNVLIGNETYIGAGSIVRDEIKIGSNCVIGMGSVVVKNIPNDSVAYGNPARIFKFNTGQKIFK